jgi:hypothetical protein
LWDVINARPDRKPTEAERSQLAAVDKEFKDLREQLLTPEEKTELALRQSNASRWAERLSGFAPTETEWRAVATAQKTFDESAKQLGDGPDRANRLNEMHDALQQEIAASLGPDRYAAYQLAQNGDYQQTRRITQRYELPEDTARQAYEVQRTAEAAAKQLNDDTSMDAPARQTALAGIRQESEQTLTTLLGAEVFGTYQKYQGNWLKQLTPPAN